MGYNNFNERRRRNEYTKRGDEQLLRLSMAQSSVQTASTEDDVEEDTAEDYTPKLTM